MENATKALMMGVSMLIGVLLLSFLVYMFIFMSDYSGAVQDNLYAKERYEFNAKFEEYTNKELTAQDVLSIINLVKDYNSVFETGSADSYAIKIIPSSYMSKDSSFLKENNKKYACNIEYDTVGKVAKITISEK